MAQQIVHRLLESEWIGVDLDGTLAKAVPGEFDKNEIGEPVPAMMKKIKQAIGSGKTIKIFTARAVDKENIPPIKAWLKKHGLPALEVTNEKDPQMTELWDDRAREVTKNKGTFV